MKNRRFFVEELFVAMSMVRELLKYSKHPSLLPSRLLRKAVAPFSSVFARMWVFLLGKERLRRGRHIFIFGAFGGRRYGDNSAVFFDYMVSEYPGIDCYWIMRKDAYLSWVGKGKIVPLSPERLLFKDSFRANVMTLLAEVHVYSHGRYDVTDYPKDITPDVIDVLLGHGITALKRTSLKVIGPGKSIAIHAEKADLLVASSEAEAEIKRVEWGIPREKIVIPGLPRHDRLLSQKGKIKTTGKEILYMPTWRSWNARVISLRRSVFFRAITAFLKDSGLSEYLYDKSFCLHLYVHMWMREFFEEFKRDFSLRNIEIVDQGDDLQKMILGSSLLITDYSSVCWDFLLVDKPVLFYQFDLAEYCQHTGSYIDLEKDLFGPVACNAKEAAFWVRNFVESDFSTGPFLPKMEEMKKFAFAHTDGKNCERLARAISERCQRSEAKNP